MTDADIAESRSRTEAAGEAGAAWLEKKRAELALLPIGTVVVIDVETGEYVTGKTRLEAMDAYDSKIGPHRWGFVHQVGRKTFLGGGLMGGALG